MTTMFGLFFFIWVGINVNSQTRTLLWSDPMDTFPSDWEVTTNADLVTSTDCPSSSVCVNVKGNGGEIVHGVETLLYKDINLLFKINVVNLASNEYCQVNYKFSSTSTTWTLLKRFNGVISSNESADIILPTLANFRAYLGFQFINSGKQQNNDACYIDDIFVYGNLSTPKPTLNPSISPIKAPTSTPIANTEDNNSQSNIEDGDFLVFDSLGNLGLFFGISMLFGCCACAPLLYAVYIVFKDTLIDSCGSVTTGTVQNKRSKKHTGQRGHSHMQYYITFGYNVLGKDFKGERQIDHGEYEELEIGHTTSVNYLSCAPCWYRSPDNCDCLCHYFCYICIVIGIFGWCCVVFIFAVVEPFGGYDNFGEVVLLLLFVAICFGSPWVCCGIFNKRFMCVNADLD